MQGHTPVSVDPAFFSPLLSFLMLFLSPDTPPTPLLQLTKWERERSQRTVTQKGGRGLFRQTTTSSWISLHFRFPIPSSKRVPFIACKRSVCVCSEPPRAPPLRTEEARLQTLEVRGSPARPPSSGCVSIILKLFAEKGSL